MRKIKKLIATAMSVAIAVTSFGVLQNFDASAYYSNSPSVSAPWAGEVVTASTALIVRSAPTTQSSVLTSMAKGSYVQIIGQSGNWWQVKANGVTGYSSKDYIDIMSQHYGIVNTVSTNLNIRADASTNSAIIASVPKGTALPFVPSGVETGWAIVVYQNQIGYVAADYMLW